MENQKTQDSQHNIEEQSWVMGHYLTSSFLESYSNQNSVVLVKKMDKRGSGTQQRAQK